MTSKGNKFILEKFLSKAQEGTTVSEGENIKITYPNGTTKIVNTASPEYAEMYKKGQIQNPENMANDIFWGGELDEVVIKGKVSELGKLRKQYSEKYSREDFINKKKDEYIKRLGKSNWYGIDRNNFPEKVLAEINQNYDYNKNTYALQQLAKKRKINLNERGAWVDNLTPQEKNALINSKYSAQLNPNEFSNTFSGIQELANTLLPGRPFNFNISGLTPKERKEDAESKLSGLKVFSLLNTPGNMIANAAKNTTTSSYGDFREKPALGSQRMGNVSEMDSMMLNPLSYEAIASLPQLAKSVKTLAKNIPGKLENFIQTGKNVFRPTREADLTAIENLSSQLREATPEAIDAARRAFHNSERFLTPEEVAMLRTHGRGAPEEYRVSTIRPADLLPNPPDELIMNPETGNLDPVNFTYSTEEALDRLRTGQSLEPQHLTQLGNEYNTQNLSLADSQAFQRYVTGNRRTIDLRRGAARDADNPYNWGTENWDPNATVRRYDLDDVYPPSDPNWNTPNYVVRNRSGFKKDDLIARADDAEKELLQNMSDDDFAKTVTKPSGQSVPYVEGLNVPQMTYNNDYGRMIHSGATPMTPEEYAQLFNDNIDRLNEIIRLNNKSGVDYQVEKLYPNGQLKFVTPEQTLRVPNRGSVRSKLNDISSDPSAPAPYQVEYSTGPEHMDVQFFDTQAEAEKFMSDLKANEPEFVDVKIDAGSTQWDTPINAGRWEGEVEDIANKDYFKSIPGLNMSVTSNTVFADRMPRAGTGTYKSLNEFLKELNLGRVKPGFNSQTNSSFNAWDKAAKKGQAVGYYNDPSLFYGVMKKYGGDNISDFEKYVMKEMGGMLYANKDEGLPHEQSMQKYLSAQNNLLDFMKRVKVVGGPVPFDEYYRENIINPRNKS